MAGIYATFADAESEARREHAWAQYAGLAAARAKARPEVPDVYAMTKEHWMAEHPPGWLEYREAFLPKGRYGKWLRDRRVSARVNGTLFMHAGPDPFGTDLDVDAIESQVRQEITRMDGFMERAVSAKLALPFFNLNELLQVAAAEIRAVNTVMEAAKQTAETPDLRGFEDCNRRYHSNPLRVLDCKVDRCVETRKGAPKVTYYLCEGCRTHFSRLLSLLELLGVSYVVNPDMVRGLDYYTRTTFEVTSKNLGAQNAVAAGGRYDRLVKEFGGPETPAIGFAMGMERIIELLKSSASHDFPRPDVFIAAIGELAAGESLVVADRLRTRGFWVEVGEAENSLKSQMRRADRLSSRYVFIIGDVELKAGRLKWKKLSDSSQGHISMFEISDFLRQQSS